jgi:hypothetical protein
LFDENASAALPPIVAGMLRGQPIVAFESFFKTYGNEASLREIPL